MSADADEHRMVTVDPDRTVELDAAGLRGFSAATVLTADGSPELVLVRRQLLGCERYVPVSPNVAPHEQDGPLPPRWHDRTWLAPTRCSRPTAAGQPCRRITTNSHPCHQHRGNHR